MTENYQITNLIDTWKPRKELADEIGANVEAVHKWAKANRIPSEWQALVVRAAQARGMEGVTADWMIESHQRKAGAA